jgi:hypothetical protein
LKSSHDWLPEGEFRPKAAARALLRIAICDTFLPRKRGQRFFPMTKKIDEALDTVDASKRSTLKRMATMSFVAPVVASFAMDGLTVGSALAADSNGS